MLQPLASPQCTSAFVSEQLRRAGFLQCLPCMAYGAELRPGRRSGGWPHLPHDQTMQMAGLFRCEPFRRHGLEAVAMNQNDDAAALARFHQFAPRSQHWCVDPRQRTRQNGNRRRRSWTTYRRRGRHRSDTCMTSPRIERVESPAGLLQDHLTRPVGHGRNALDQPPSPRAGHINQGRCCCKHYQQQRHEGPSERDPPRMTHQRGKVADSSQQRYTHQGIDHAGQRCSA